MKIVLMLTLLSATAASTAHAAEPGRDLFERRCEVCHAAGNMGALALGSRLGADKAILAARTDLLPAYTRLVVRKGVGIMPPITRVELTDEDLEAVVRYLTVGRP